MSFIGFEQKDFDTFHIEGLEARMEAIRSRIQPKFQAIAHDVLDETAVHAGHELFLHIAKHARRTVNAPVDTWMALAHNKRGYKQHPHFQVGLFDDHVFLWFALIYELPNKQAIAESFLKHLPEIREQIPENYVISFDHMKKDATPVADLGESEWTAALQRFRDVKKVELLIGRHIDISDPILHDGSAFLSLVKDTFISLSGLYRLALRA